MSEQQARLFSLCASGMLLVEELASFILCLHDERLILVERLTYYSANLLVGLLDRVSPKNNQRPHHSMG